ncbi:hypothetical protein AALP_AA6G041400 [Arabis alpina]|uniref:Uncharacterized protein n=1 Tax=Arabis alpina TaxID=50452 RepID=A0A087GM04_ARAAL|nr:hypothetical protein AALP_AA6G041400 [Arabis alpina]
MGARNLQDETATYPDLEDAFERSQYDWLGYGDLRKIFDSCDELPLSTAHVDPFEEEALYGDEGIRSELGRCDLEPLDKGVKSVLERRIYSFVDFEKFCLTHYRITHHAGGHCLEDTDETLKNSAGSNGNGDASGDIRDDDALSALNTDFSDGHDADATDITPVPAATASTTIVVNELTEARKEKEATLHS